MANPATNDFRFTLEEIETFFVEYLSSEDFYPNAAQLMIAKDVKRVIETGDLELTFADGTQCQDSGTLASNPGSTSQRFHSTRDGQITLSGKKLDRGEELIVWVLYDKANLRKDIKSIRMKADG